MDTPRPLGRHAHALCSSAASDELESRDRELVGLVEAAAAGDDAAWRRLVERFDASLRRTARSFGLSAADVDDAVQSAWTRLFTSIRTLENPAAIGAWLATTTRRESLRLLQRRVNEQLTDDELLGDRAEPFDPMAGLVAAELRAALADALSGLPERHRRLMVLLAIDPTTDYRRISDALSMPVGSIGPIRRRCLTRLAGHARLHAMWSAATQSV
jgi:RNA polymerase sigma factor (sigma-70 family)